MTDQTINALWFRFGGTVLKTVSSMGWETHEGQKEGQGKSRMVLKNTVVVYRHCCDSFETEIAVGMV